MKKIVLLSLLGFGVRLGLLVHGATNALVVTPELVNQFAAEMRTNHPALAAAAARTNAAGAGVAAVRTWEEPMLKLGGMAAEEMMRAEDGDIAYGLEQKLPLWGKSALARRVARAELDIEIADAEMRFQELRSALAQALFRAAFAQRTIAVGEEDLATSIWRQKTGFSGARSKSACGSPIPSAPKRSQPV